jgi:hypothetical protein
MGGYEYERTPLGLFVARERTPVYPVPLWLPDGVAVQLPPPELAPAFHRTPDYLRAEALWMVAVLSDRAQTLSPLDRFYGDGWGSTLDSITALPTT